MMKIVINSFRSLIICLAVMAYTAFCFYPKWTKAQTEATISWDVSGYYLYLPALFIYHDIKKVSFLEDVISKYHPTPEIQQVFNHEKSGSRIMKYSIGQAVLMSPFFLAGHSAAKVSGSYPADGFSYPYQLALGFGMFLYSVLGLILLRKLLLHFFKDSTVAIVLPAIAIGSNYLNYASIDQCLTHSTLFTLYTALMLCTIRFYNKPGWKWAIFIGTLCGLAALIRPTDAISVLIPLCWNITSWEGLKSRIAFVFNNWPWYFAAAFAMGAIGMLQLLYWKYVGNEWLIYSYQQQGFSWLHPHWHDFTFSFYSGWLMYCPLMMLAILGFINLIQRKQNHFTMLGFALLAYYIVVSWDVWDYGGISGRAMVQYYPVLAFPLASLVERVNLKTWTRCIFYPILILAAYVNIWWVYQAHGGQVPAIGLTKELYYKAIGRWSISPHDLKLFDNRYNFEGSIKEAVSLYKTDFEGDTSAVSTSSGIKGKGLFLQGQLQYTPEITIKNEGQFKQWIRVYTDVRSTQKEWNNWAQQQLVYKFYNGNDLVLQGGLKFHRFMQDNETNRLYLDALVPSKKAWDRLGIFYWNPGSDKLMTYDNLEVVTFNE